MLTLFSIYAIRNWGYGHQECGYLLRDHEIVTQVKTKEAEINTITVKELIDSAEGG